MVNKSNETSIGVSLEEYYKSVLPGHDELEKIAISVFGLQSTYFDT